MVIAPTQLFFDGNAMPESVPHLKPPVLDSPCPKCGHAHASLLLKTDFAIYLNCERCQHRWNELPQRQSPQIAM